MPATCLVIVRTYAEDTSILNHVKLDTLISCNFYEVRRLRFSCLSRQEHVHAT